MESRVKLFGHPVHAMLIPFPLGLLITSFIFDIIYLVTDSDAFSIVAFWMIAAGVIGGLAAAVFGIIDFPGVPDDTRADPGPVGIIKQALEANKSVVATLFSLVCESANTRQPP
jgi:uncharacterized membrane protein